MYTYFSLKMKAGGSPETLGHIYQTTCYPSQDYFWLQIGCEMFLTKVKTAVSTQAYLSLNLLLSSAAHIFIYLLIYNDRVASNSLLYTIKLAFKVSLRSSGLFNATFSVGEKS
jgi:hypothetical protein